MDIQTMPYSRLDKLEQRIAELESEVKHWQSEWNNAANRNLKFFNRIAELESDNKKLKDALKAIWGGTHVGMPAWEFVEATLKEVEIDTDGTGGQ